MPSSFNLERELVPFADESGLLRITDKIFEKLGPHPTEASILNLSEYHQLKKRKDLSREFMMFISSSLSEIKLDQQAEYWDKRMKKERQVSTLDHPQLENEEPIPLGNLKHAQCVLLMKRLSYYLGYRHKDFISWATDKFYFFPEVEDLDYRLSIAMSIVFAQMKLEQFQEIITETLPNIEYPLFSEDQKDKLDLVAIRDYFTEISEWLYRTKKDQASVLHRIALLACIKGAAFLGLNEAKLGLDFFHAGKMILEAAYTKGVMYSNYAFICNCYFGEMDSSINEESMDDGTKGLNLKYLFQRSSKMLEEIPIPLYMIFRYFENVRGSVTSEEIQKQISVHKNSIAVRSHFSSKLQILQGLDKIRNIYFDEQAYLTFESTNSNGSVELHTISTRSAN